MRIIAGQWRGRRLEAPPGPGTRPTADRTRETLFSMLASRLGSFEGLTVAEAREVVAAKARQPAARVTLALADCRAGRVYLTGPENGRQRVVPFRGPEPVMEFLWRAGAMRQGTAELRAVHVVRPNVAAGTRPETFTIDVEAITLDRDHRTNVILRASDQVVVGETRRSSFSRLLPSWLQPLYHRLAGLLPPEVWLGGSPTPGFSGGMGIPGEAHSS